MYTSSIVKWTLDKANFINKYIDNIRRVRITHSTEVYFGRKYYRIYFLIETDFPHHYVSYMEMTESERDMNNIENRFFNSSSNFIAFPALPYDEKEIELHYEYITSLFYHIVRNRPFKYEVNEYISESKKEYLREVEREELEIKNQEFLNSPNLFASIGDLIIIRRYVEERLIQIEDNKISLDHPYTGRELNLNFALGKRFHNYISEKEILIVMTQEQMAAIIRDARIKTKKELINILIETEHNYNLKYNNQRVRVL